MVVLAIIFTVIAATWFIVKFAGLNCLTDEEDERRERDINLAQNRQSYIKEKVEGCKYAGGKYRNKSSD